MSKTGTLCAKELFPLYKGLGEPQPGCAPVVRQGESGRYIADERLKNAVQTAVALERPLLVTGEPGTGKTCLAWSIASELGLGKVLVFHTRSDHYARDALYTFDHVLRFYHAQTQQTAAADPTNYVTPQALGQAIQSDSRRVVLIDEIDKAPRDFPNDLLNELDRMEFTVKETGQHFVSTFRPIVIITSNSEKQLPDPFLRRCIFHWINFPGEKQLRNILHEHIHTNLPEPMVDAALARFQELRQMGESGEIDKKPATDELVSWVRMLLLAGVNVETVRSSPLSELPHVCALIKTYDDMKKLPTNRRS